MVFGIDTFGYQSHLFNARDKVAKAGPSFKQISGGSAVKEDLGSGGRWSEGGKALTLLDEDHIYLVLNPGYELTIVVHDLESGAKSTKTASGASPVIQVGGQNAVVRMKTFINEKGETFDYSTTPTIG